MFRLKSPTFIATVLATLLLATSLRAADTLPSQLSDDAFWKLIAQISESDGIFASDNFVSNELGLQTPIPALQAKTRPGGVYLGVGPEQNFTYIASLQPKVAFIIDIRRQNLVEHLFYKALFEMSVDRADFLARLFCRQRPEGLTTSSTATELFKAYSQVSRSSEAFQMNRDEVREWLLKKHGFALTDQDLTGLDRIYTAFFNYGPDITYYSGTPSSSRSLSPENSRGSPSYAVMEVATDEQGINHGYLAGEEDYRRVRDLEMKNLVIPLVGDFGGPRALRGVASYLKDHQATLTAFYTSNVEQYLFRPTAQTPNGGWRRFIASVAAFPLDSSSMFIRVIAGSYANHPNPSVVQPIQETLQAVKEGRIEKHADLFSPRK